LPQLGHLASAFAHIEQPGLPHFAQGFMLVAQELSRMAPSAMGSRNNVFMMLSG